MLAETIDYGHPFLAKIYDSRVLCEPVLRVDPSSGFSQDGNFLVSMAKEISPGKSVFEFGIGTGRLSQQFARSGFSVVGIDNSDEMLKVARAKHSLIEKNTVLLKGDWTYTSARSSHGGYSTCVVAYSSFFRLLKSDTQLSFLQHAKSLLVKGGVILIDTFFPDEETLAKGSYLSRVDFQTPFGRCRERLYAKNSLERRQISSDFRYLPTWERKVYSHKYQLTWLFPDEMALLLKRAGFGEISYHFDYEINEAIVRQKPKFVTYVGIA